MRVVTGIVLLTFLMLPHAAMAMAMAELKVAVDVTCGKPLKLKVSVRNNSGSRVDIQESLLPWNHFNAVRMEAYRIADGTSKRLVGVSPIADYLGLASVNPGQTVSGEIVLNRSFAHFDEENADGDILLFYRVNNRFRAGSVSFSGPGGAVLIPRRNFFLQKCPVLVKPLALKESL